MSQPAAPQRPAQPPDPTVMGMTVLGREVYLLACSTCGALVAVLRRSYVEEPPGPAAVLHADYHRDRGETPPW